MQAAQLPGGQVTGYSALSAQLQERPVALEV